MPRERTGSLELRPNGWHARLTVDVKTADGATRKQRRWVPLGTFDKGRAQRMLAKLVAEIAAGRIMADAQTEARKPDTVEESARAWVEARKARGVAMADYELGYLKHHVFPVIGSMPVADVRRADIRRVLDAAVLRKPQKGSTPTLSRETVTKIRAVLHRFFGALEADEKILTNPVRGVDVPKARVDKRPRTMVLDAEYNALFACPDISVETKVLALTARTLGGARTAECLRWDWSMIDRAAFEVCTLPRAKTGDFQQLEIPELLRPFLRAWWAKHDCPEAGPVFPITRGPRKGTARGKTSFAGRMRRALRKAILWAKLPLRPELLSDTAHSLKTDFHSRRREYVSALATSGTNEQTAMALAHHADSKVHRRYQIAQIRQVPTAALPQIDAAALAVLPRPVDDSAERLPQVAEIRAGHGIRTRDIQLGKRVEYTQSGVTLRNASFDDRGSAYRDLRGSAVTRSELAPLDDSLFARMWREQVLIQGGIECDDGHCWLW